MDNLRGIMAINLHPIESKGILQFTFIVVNLQENLERIWLNVSPPYPQRFPTRETPLKSNWHPNHFRQVVTRMLKGREPRNDAVRGRSHGNPP